MRVGIVGKFRGQYPLGDALDAFGCTVVRLEATDLAVRDNQLTCAGTPVAVDAVLWRLSEEDWPTYRRLGWKCAEVVPVVNAPAAIDLCGDKLATAACLAAAGLPVVPGYSVGPGDPIPDLGAQTIVKPVAGAQGRGVHLAAPGEVAPAHADEAWMAQPWAGAPDTHLRVLVVGGGVVCAYRRGGAEGDLIRRADQGGTRHFTTPPAEAVHLAQAAIEACGAHYAGVDLVPDPWRVLEVNSCSGVPPTRVEVAANAFAALLRGLGAATP